MSFSFSFSFWSAITQKGNLKRVFLNFQVIVNIATRRGPIITRSRSQVLRNSVNMSTYPESSDRPVMAPSTDLVNLGARLSELLNKFNIALQ